jgi:hypothetical protein
MLTGVHTVHCAMQLLLTSAVASYTSTLTVSDGIDR